MDSILTDQQFSKLDKSIDWSNAQLKYIRDKRVGIIKDLVGKHYMTNGSNVIMPVNSLRLAYNIHVRYLAPRNPRGMFTTKIEELMPTAKNFELAVNQIPDEIKLGSTLRKIVSEAIVSMGVARCGLHAVSSIMGFKYGEPFVECISIDNYFCDLSAESWEQIQYEGHDYWMDFEDFEQAEWLDKAERTDLKYDVVETTGPQGETLAKSIGSGNSSPEVFKERILLRDVWLPKEKTLITYAVKSKKILASVTREDDAPPPYYKLGFIYVPGNLLPLPPVAGWKDLNDVGNAVFRKLGASADAFKEVLGFNSGDDSNVEAFQQARHGSGIKYTGAQPQRLTAGGIDKTSLAFYLQVKELQSYFSNGMDSLGGLAPMSSTIGQDKLLADSASAQMRDMTDQTIDFIRDLFKALAYYEWNNPVKKRKLSKPVAGTDINVPVEWDQDAKQGEFKDFDIDIDVYSLPDDSPSLRLQKMGAFVGQYVLPFIPAIQQAGGNIEVEKILETAARLANMPEAKTFVSFPDDPVPMQGGGGSQMQYTGVPGGAGGGSASAGPQAGPNDGLMEALLSGGE